MTNRSILNWRTQRAQQKSFNFRYDWSNRNQIKSIANIHPIGTSAAQDKVCHHQPQPTDIGYQLLRVLFSRNDRIPVSSLSNFGSENPPGIFGYYLSSPPTVVNQFKPRTWSGDIVHLDEVLNLCQLRMAASTGMWREKTSYRQFEPEVTSHIKQLQLVPQVLKKVNRLKLTLLTLVEFENRAFALLYVESKLLNLARSRLWCSKADLRLHVIIMSH